MALPIPFSEPPYLAGFPSPLYSPSHLSWQKACRAFLEENLTQYAMDWERDEFVPAEVFDKFAAANMLIPSLPAPLPIKWLKQVGVHDILGVVNVEDWDYVHTAIYADEVYRCANSSILERTRSRGRHFNEKRRWLDPDSWDPPVRSPRAWPLPFRPCSNTAMMNYKNDFYPTCCLGRRGPAWPSPSLMPGRMSPTSKLQLTKPQMESITS